MYGSNDPYLTAERFKKIHAITKKLSTHVGEIVFEGGHEIDAAISCKMIGIKEKTDAG